MIYNNFSIEISDILLSTLRWFLGLVIGSLLALFFYFLEFLPNFFKVTYNKIFHFFRAIPIIGFVPLIEITIGAKEYAKIGLISWAVMFPIWISLTVSHKKRFPNTELMLKGIRVNNTQFIKLYLLPRIISGFIAGIKIGIGIAWLSVVAAEWIGTYTNGFWGGGLGHLIDIEYSKNEWYNIVFILIVFGLLGVITEAIWSYFVKKIFKKVNLTY